MTDVFERTFATDLGEEEAARDIAKAVSARPRIARRYVKRVRPTGPAGRRYSGAPVDGPSSI